MKATELRLGNIVAAIDEPGNPDVVIVLEPGVIHLMSRTEADDENNVVGIPVTQELLSEHRIGEETTRGGKTFRILGGVDPGTFRLRMGEWTIPFTYMHELQNLVHALSGEDLIKHPYIHFVGENV
jgi:hypothetical protein